MAKKFFEVLFFVVAIICINYYLFQNEVSEDEVYCEKILRYDFLYNYSSTYFTKFSNLFYDTTLADLENSLYQSWIESENVEPILLQTKSKNPRKTALVMLHSSNFSNDDATLANINNVVKTTSLDDMRYNSLAIIFDENFANVAFIKHLIHTYIFEIQIGFLQLFKVGSQSYTKLLSKGGINPDLLIEKDTVDFIASSNNHYEKEFLLMKMLFKSGNYLKTSFNYLIIFDDQFEILIDKYFAVIDKYINKTLVWSIINFSDHSSGKILGKMIHSEEIFKFSYFFLFYFSNTANKKIIRKSDIVTAYYKYIRLTYQPYTFVARPTIFVDKKSLKGIKYKNRDEMKEAIFKDKDISDDPQATIVTNMQAIDEAFGVEMLYATWGDKYFHAISPKKYDWIVLVFDENVVIDRLIIRSGLLGSINDTLLNGAIVEVSPKLLYIETSRNSVRCADYTRVGIVDSALVSFTDLSLKIRRPTKCLKITLNNINNPHNLVVRQIAIYN